MNRAFNGEMLLVAREARGLTQTELAGLAGISQPYISRLENAEENRPSNEQVASLQRALGFPREFFFLPERRTGIGLSFIYFRKKATTSAGAVRRIEAIVNLRRIQICRLLEDVSVECPFAIESLDLESYGDPAHVARLVRATWKLPSGPVTNLVDSIEKAGGVILREPMKCGGIDALSHWMPPAPPIFLVDSGVPTDRMRWSLAHELGHAVMHQVPSDEIELEANEFANEFLMPREEILRDLSNLTIERAAKLKPYWRVSMAALIRRASTLGAITQERYRTLMIQLSRFGYRKHEPVELTAEVPKLLTRVLLAHVEGMGRSATQIAKKAVMLEDELLSVFSPGVGRIQVVVRPNSRNGAEPTA